MLKGKRTVISVIFAMGAVFMTMAEDKAMIEADFNKPKTSVSKNLFGIFYEDINSAADGGLYGELIQNRSFEYERLKQSATEHWELVNLNGKKGKTALNVSVENPMSKANPTFVSLTVKKAGDGISNSGYGGIVFEKGKKYPGCVYLRSPDASVESVIIVAGGKGKKAKQCKCEITGITTEWKKYEFTIEAEEDVTDGQLAVCAATKGKLDIDFVSLFRADIYKNEVNGFRKDLAEKLEEMHPAFIRFPGGCIVQGKYQADRYQWKKSIGPVEEREEGFNFWGYQHTYGIGFYEYFRFCEDIGAEPIPILSCGLSWKSESNLDEKIPMDKMQPFVQDALDLIEYARGSADSEWGKKRAEAGHPEPFKLNYLGIGNEDLEGHYFERYKLIADAVKAKYPDIKLIMSAGPLPADRCFFDAWKQTRSWEKENEKTGSKNIVDLIDEHYYSPDSWMLSNTKRYDDKNFYPREANKAKVFIGEYASWVAGRKNNLYAALTEAAYMTGIERNADVIEIASYAPLFAKVGYTQWIPDAIWFNNSTVYASPNYYVQQLFMTHKSDRTISYNVIQPEVEKKQKTIGGTVGLGTWLTTAEYKDITLTKNPSGEVVYSSGEKVKLSDFRIETGSWDNKGEKLVQSSKAENVRIILDKEQKLYGVSNYTFETKAKKTDGNEGFLILFGVDNKNLYWWNIGGWGNTQSAVEKGSAEGRTVIGSGVPLKLESNKWYDIKIEVAGDTYRCYLDGKLIHEYTDVEDFDSVYAHVGETDDGKVYVKIINISSVSHDIRIKLDNVPSLKETGLATVISGNADDENSFDNPTLVAPKTSVLSGVSNDFNYSVSPNSATVLELYKE